MSKRIKNLLAVIMAVAMVASLCVGTALATDGQPSGDPPALPEGEGGGEGGGGGMPMTPTTTWDGTEEGFVVEGDYVTLTVGTTDAEGNKILIGSWSGGGDEDYVYTSSVLVKGDQYWIGTQFSPENAIKEKKASGIVINDSTSGHNGFTIIDAGDYTISNAQITMNTTADGQDTCDFSGVGSAIAVYGDSNVTIESSTIETTGVATMPIFGDGGSTVTVKNSTLKSNGGTLYSAYLNTPDQAVMVAPPWILGIMGTSRTTNLMGTNSTMNFMDSTTSAGAWAVLSTDSGTNMYLNIYNTSLTLNNANEAAAAALQAEGGQISVTNDNPYTTRYGAGYGTYAIGAAVETFAGATLNVGTYATIFTGGTATYTNIEAGKSYILKNAADAADDVTYTATESKVTTINSDTFGFMIHQGENYITINNGTVVNSGYATFLVKSGSSGETVTATVDNATINNGGVLIQVMDNDDATTGGMMAADDPRNTNGAGMNFVPEHTENEGFNTAAAENDGTYQSFTFTNGEYNGNIYNASGSDSSTAGALGATTLNVIIGEGATLTGAAASTAAIHVTYEGSQIVKNNGGYAYESVEAAKEVLAEQNTSIDISEYYDIGHVANLINYNGGNDINIYLAEDGVWNVTENSDISMLVLAAEAKLVVAEGTTLKVDSLQAVDGDKQASANTEITIEAGTYDVKDIYEIAEEANPETTTPEADTTGTTPEVGDSADMMLWIVLAAMAVAGGSVLVVRRRKEN